MELCFWTDTAQGRFLREGIFGFFFLAARFFGHPPKSRFSEKKNPFRSGFFFYLDIFSGFLFWRIIARGQNSARVQPARRKFWPPAGEILAAAKILPAANLRARELSARAKVFLRAKFWP